ncbi:hypothetical protein HC931_01115 [Candidatus Gracilibacteria bacterium]|nr:hypothetical protein [Candidatus Gracilibacteria bacterium]NJM87409.1 hypothetical protein [Hydrococcus sp. RU_2_2]NJP20830.1 hypothetical protein [Hydrococcus sp. CRU_1_1]NJQ96801.1 hypothetical protein [Hydrococcus sp. CSU_1_8]
MTACEQLATKADIQALEQRLKAEINKKLNASEKPAIIQAAISGITALIPGFLLPIKTELGQVKGTANAAKSTATTAQSTANTAKSAAGTARTIADAAKVDAGIAKELGKGNAQYELKWASLTINVLIVSSGIIVFFGKDNNGVFTEVLKTAISGYIGFLGRGIIEKVKAD